MHVSHRIILGLILALGACGNPSLRDLRKPGDGPDEFLILPTKALEAPETYAELPQPTPGGANLTDPRPLDDAVTRLGGRPQALGGIPASDSSIVRHTSRFGVPADIRATLAEADERFRKRRGRLTKIKLANIDRYKDVYRREALDPQAETRRFRNIGVRTPTSPPPQ